MSFTNCSPYTRRVVRQQRNPNFFTAFDGFLNMDKVINEAFGTQKHTDNVAQVNISETDTHYSIAMAIPGFLKNEVNISLKENVLSISGEKTATNDTTEETNPSPKFIRQEFSYNKFSRTFHIPETVNVAGINAKHENGILTVNLPKVVKQKPTINHIEIA
jgi:HSP20 family protein